MAKKNSRDVRLISLRVPVELADQIEKETVSSGDSLNEHVVDMLEDLHTWFGLPGPMIEILEGDRQRAGIKNFREYIRALLAKHHNEVLLSTAGKKR